MIFFTSGDHLVILGGTSYYSGHGEKTLSDVEVLDMQDEVTGCEPTDLPSAVSRHASVYSSTLQSVITCGGERNDRRCFVQNKNGDKISFPEMNSGRSWFTMVSIRNQIVAIGGSASKNTIETIRLNATLTKWDQQSMPFSVDSHCAVTLDNNVIIIGGRDENNKVNRKFYLHLCNNEINILILFYMNI